MIFNKLKEFFVGLKNNIKNKEITKKIIAYMKIETEKKLMLLGFYLAILYGIFTKVNNIPTVNNWAAFIGVVLFFGPFLTGLWMVSEKIKVKRKILSQIIKFYTIIGIIALIGSFFVVLFIK